ncbi:hypothetical protein [Veillonella agrestimuris]|uniref:hypothetical protein n=1 Tax=Veillonella agrestimuris TaxID=2941340 RepID=UPI00204177CC|nr:hypothetical protein [Veillonella agrestimuris]
MKKQILSRLLLSGLLATTLFVVAGCGETPEEKQAKLEQAVQEVAQQEEKAKIALADKLSKADTWTKAISKLKEKGELKSAPVQISGTINYLGRNKSLEVDVVKPGTTELLRYRYDLNNDTWGDGEPVQVIGDGKKQIAQTFYPIDNLNVDMIITVLNKFKQEGETNPAIKESYRGYFDKAKMGWDPNQGVHYEVAQEGTGRVTFIDDTSIDAVYDEAGNLVKLRVKAKGSQSIQTLM